MAGEGEASAPSLPAGGNGTADKGQSLQDAPALPFPQRGAPNSKDMAPSDEFFYIILGLRVNFRISSMLVYFQWVF